MRKTIDKLMPNETKLRYFLELGVTGITAIHNEGWRSFFRRARNWIKTQENSRTYRLNSIQKLEKSTPKLKRLLKLITFPDATSKPEVSIIIPAFNKWKYTANCLYSIFKYTQANYEVIVIDDASTDITKEVFSSIKNLIFIQNENNLGFVDSCNLGAKRSKGDYILFLNNDTIVTPNWLQTLVETIKKDNVGAVGSKLLYPNGALQEAGAIIWNDGSPLNYGRGDNPEKPQYNYVREVDYCTGACLLVKRELFMKIGGFDVRFRPGYFEETDLCFSIRNLGFKVIYQPLSHIVHFEGITSGTNSSKGIKKFQVINKAKFISKWENILQRYQYEPDMENILSARNKREGKQILVIDHSVPTYDKDSGSLRMFNILAILSQLGHKVTFIGDNMLELQPYSQELQQQGIEVIYNPFVPSIEDYIHKNGKHFEIVMLSRPNVTNKYLNIVKEVCKDAIIIYDTVDLAFLRESRRSTLENDSALMNQADALKTMELSLAKNSDIVFVVSEAEKEILLKENPSLRIEIVSNIHQIRKPINLFSQRKDILFVGGFNHLPNIDAVIYFVDQILPLVKKRIPEIRFYIAGSNPPAKILNLRTNDVIVTGYVKDLSSLFEACRVFVAPLRYGAGVKGKINQSMSYGLPVVTTNIGAEGMGLVDGMEVLIADEPDKFADQISILYKNEALWNNISLSSIENVKINYSYEVTKRRLNNIIEGFTKLNREVNFSDKMVE